MTPQRMIDRLSLLSWKTWLWWLVFGIVLLVISAAVLSGRLCAYLGTDFRGYYAAAQIALEEGFGQVYDQRLQSSYQAELAYTCPDSTTAPPLLFVSMPYLPAYGLIFLPLQLLNLTTSYILWSALNLILLFLYTLRFSRCLGERPTITQQMQWLVCLPVLANIALGQINVFLVICLGEFILAAARGREWTSGIWLAGMLIKPHLLILLVPGLAIAKKWKTLLGFSAGAVIILSLSLILAGVKGVLASIQMAIRFAGPLIQTGPTMTNWRALALNLALFLPDWAAWLLAGFGILITAAAVLSLWQRSTNPNSEQVLMLGTVAIAGAIAISWHAHFYLLMLLIPSLIVLDLKHKIPTMMLAAWTVGPAIVYAGAFLLVPELARNLLGLTYLGISLGLVSWVFLKLGPGRFVSGRAET